MPDSLPPIFLTKLHRPRVARDLVLRPRLLERLDAALDRRLALVCAPAGFGKTTLVSSWLEQREGKGRARLPAAWLSLDKNDSAVDQFTHYVIAALRTVFADACPETLELLQAQRDLPIRILATSLANEIQQLSGSFVLVLDDFQAIQGEAVPDLLNELIGHWPHPLHLVLISRTNPPLPWSRLRANDGLIEIRSNDLRFRNDETTAFLGRALQTLISEPMAEMLTEWTEGWIGALRLATITLRSRGNINDALTTITKSEENIAVYLADEVLARQFPAIQTFMLKTAILDRFCGPLCEVLIDEPDPAWSVQACIDWLDQEELLITPLDDRRNWYRFHQLLRDMLRMRLSTAMKPEQIKDLHRRASAWFEREGLWDEALEHALLAGDIDLGVSLVERGLRDVLNREDRGTLERWLRFFPDEFVQDRPWLLMLKAWALSFSWQLAPLSDCLDRAGPLIEELELQQPGKGNAQLLRANWLTLKGQQAYFSNQPAQAVTYCQQAMTLLPGTWTFPRGGAMLYLGLGMQAIGDGLAAERMLLDLYDRLDDQTDGFALRLLLTLSINYLNEGLLVPAQNIASAMLLQATRGGISIQQGWAHCLLGIIHYYWNELDAAVPHFEDVLRMPYSVHPLALRSAMLGTALLHQSRGESSSALQIQELAGQHDIERYGSEGVAVRSLRARLMLLQGSMVEPLRWADSQAALLLEQPQFWLEHPDLTRARILFARNAGTDGLDALQILDGLYDLAVRNHNVGLKMETQAVRALVLDGLGRAAEARIALLEAVDLARPGGFIRFFIELGQPMRGLLANLAQDASYAQALGGVLAAFPENGKPIASVDAWALTGENAVNTPWTLSEPLTPRELQILALMQKPLSYKQIARDLSISYPTIKRHTINIYGKLRVNSRWDAVARGVALGIISSG